MKNQFSQRGTKLFRRLLMLGGTMGVALAAHAYDARIEAPK